MRVFNLFKLVIVASFSCLFVVNGHAAQWARVKSDKAIIYSDPHMSSPIGFVNKGKKLRVGSNAKNKNQVLAIIVTGRVAYIKVSDIRTGEVKSDLETVSQRLKDKIDKPNIERKMALYYHGAGGYTQFEDSTDLLEFSGYGIRGYYTELDQNLTYRVAIDSIKITHPLLELNMISIPLDYSKKIFTIKRLDFNLYAGVVLVPQATFKANTLFELNGYGAGGNFGAEFTYKLTKKMFLHFDGNYYYLKLTGYRLPENDVYIGTLDPSVSGIRAGLSLSYMYQ